MNIIFNREKKEDSIDKEERLFNIGIVTIILLVLLLIILIVYHVYVSLVTLNNTHKSNDSEHILVEVDSDEGSYTNFNIYYDKDTKVMYILEYHGGVTPMFNPDGTLKLYKESEDN